MANDLWGPAGTYEQAAPDLYKGTTPVGTPVATSQPGMMPQGMNPRLAIRATAEPRATTAAQAGVPVQAVPPSPPQPRQMSEADRVWADYQRMQAISQADAARQAAPQYRGASMWEIAGSQPREWANRIGTGIRQAFNRDIDNSITFTPDDTRLIR